MSDLARQVAKLIGPLARQTRLMINRCLLTRVDDTGGLQRLQVSLLARPTPDGFTEELADNVEVVRQYGFTAVPHVGAEGVHLSIGGVRAHGLIVAVEDRRYRLAGLAGGEVAIYDDLGQTVHLTRAGIVIKGAGRPVTITDTPKVRLETEMFEVTGDVLDRCDDTGRTMRSMRDVYNGHEHPQPGTSAPGEPM